MSQIKLLHSGGNGVILSAPASNPASDRTLTLPGDADGTILTSNSSTGKILQVVSTSKTDTASQASTDNFVDISGMSQSITPSATSSKILIMYAMRLSCNSDDNIAHRLMRDSTAIHIGDAAGSRTQVTGCIRIIGNEKYDMRTESSVFLDSPSTTSATTYKLQWTSTYATGNFYLNRDDYNADNNDYTRGASSITAMEVAA